MKVCIYAFSTSVYFFRDLVVLCQAKADPIEWSIIFPQGHFRNGVNDIIPSERRCYLYDRFDFHYKACGVSEIDRSLASGEGLQVALLKDKHGYRRLEKGEQLRRGSAIDSCYREFLERVKPDYVLFPDLEVVDGFIVMNLCQELGIGVLHFSGMRHLGTSFFAPDCYKSLPPYFGEYSEADLQAARVVCRNFKAGVSRVAATSYSRKVPPKPSLFRRLVISTWLKYWRERRHATEENMRMRITRNFLPLMGIIRRLRFELLESYLFDVTRQKGQLPEKYVLYALHTTPESSINGLEPYYVDQLRVIDALLLNLPGGHRLVVKEHAAMYGMRPNVFYQELRRRPALVLVHPAYDMQKLMAKASIVTTVTGTVGLEAYLSGKPCVMFGRTFFSHLCMRAPEIHQLKKVFTELAAEPPQTDDVEKEIEIARLLNVSADFFIGDPWFFPTVMAPENVGMTRDYLLRYMRRLGV